MTLDKSSLHLFITSHHIAKIRVRLIFFHAI